MSRPGSQRAAARDARALLARRLPGSRRNTVRHHLVRAAHIAAAARTLGQQRIAAAGTGLAALPALGGVAELGFGAELDPFTQLATILGGPTTLTESESAQFANAEDFARAFSESFGRSRSRQQSSSSSTALSFGF